MLIERAAQEVLLKLTLSGPEVALLERLMRGELERAGQIRRYVELNGGGIVPEASGWETLAKKVLSSIVEARGESRASGRF